jgi:hypothetical protein
VSPASVLSENSSEGPFTADTQQTRSGNGSSRGSHRRWHLHAPPGPHHARRGVRARTERAAIVDSDATSETRGGGRACPHHELSLRGDPRAGRRRKGSGRLFARTQTITTASTRTVRAQHARDWSIPAIAESEIDWQILCSNMRRAEKRSLFPLLHERGRSRR